MIITEQCRLCRYSYQGLKKSFEYFCFVLSKSLLTPSIRHSIVIGDKFKELKPVSLYGKRTLFANIHLRALRREMFAFFSQQVSNTITSCIAEELSLVFILKTFCC
jgi:hypothetical protein